MGTIVANPTDGQKEAIDKIAKIRRELATPEGTSSSISSIRVYSHLSSGKVIKGGGG